MLRKLMALTILHGEGDLMGLCLVERHIHQKPLHFQQTVQAEFQILLVINALTTDQAPFGQLQ